LKIPRNQVGTTELFEVLLEVSQRIGKELAYILTGKEQSSWFLQEQNTMLLCLF
jgi:hypothetical protein